MEVIRELKADTGRGFHREGYKEYKDSLLENFYLSLLGRSVDLQGSSDYTKSIRGGAAPGDIRRQIARSDEFKKRLGDVSSKEREQSIRFLYGSILNRVPDPQGEAHYLSSSKSVDEIKEEMLTSQEFTDRFITLRKAPPFEKQQAFIALYHSLFGKIPSFMFNDRVLAIRYLKGTFLPTYGQTREWLLRGKEYRAKIQREALVRGNASAVNLLYNEVLGREIDDVGRRDYIDAQVDPLKVLDSLLSSNEFVDKFSIQKAA